ncbi:Arabinanase/levansucrase/invertase [Tothia fuscella]|uniref:Endo-1,5-alpha-L-arabinanase A n=1 Tax=Tothia fuscella TaxID=1048955 RepID=A0A9P4NG65_9PEZI|nr:Arabinanase/levansucrase/invertase [Tothia fuscella]
MPNDLSFTMLFLYSVFTLFFLCSLRILASTIAAPSVYTDYLFAYFTGEGSPDGETISLAITSHNNISSWTELHSSKPVLTSTVGTRGVRDPSIIRSRDATKFWIIATDLKMHGMGKDGWSNSVQTGSKSIVIWESTDLKKWNGPRLVRISPETAGNTWAPEAIYDAERGEYMLFWASSLYPKGSQHTRPSYHRILKCYTKDFIKFSEAEVWIDRSWSVIDTTVVFDADTKRWYRFSKDERGNGPNAPNGKFVFQEWSTTLGGVWREVAAGIGKGVIKQGEGPTVVRSNGVPGKWYMFIDEFGGKGYVPFETTNIASGVWKPVPNGKMPKRPRHGSVTGM